MTTGCVRSTLEPEHRLMPQENKHLVNKNRALENLVDRKSDVIDDEEEEAVCAENQEGDQKKKPRRKDTPVLNTPPLIPGVKLLQAEKQIVHLEDEEKDVKD